MTKELEHALRVIIGACNAALLNAQDREMVNNSLKLINEQLGGITTVEQTVKE